jgi:hypothetical protein
MSPHNKALEFGVNLFDTAPAYGAGHCEKILGQALIGRRDKVVIATKFGKKIDEQKRWFGRPQPRKMAVSLAVGLPVLTLIVAGITPAYRVSQRVNDGNLQARLVHGNGVSLIWAPDGPGWPREGGDWFEARHACQHLSVDGLSLAASPKDIWRLPTVDEAVRSMARHGQNSGGVWDAEVAEATYETPPDKESPLWNVYSQVIYWWTETEVEEKQAFIIVYDGKVWPRSKDFGPDYLGFRCVK